MKNIRILFALLAITTIIMPSTSAMRSSRGDSDSSQGCATPCKRSRMSPSNSTTTESTQPLQVTDADRWLLQSAVRNDYENYLLNTSSTQLSFDAFEDKVILPGLRMWAIDGHYKGKWILPRGIIEELIKQIDEAKQ